MIFVSTLCNYKYIKQSTNNFQAYSELFAPLLSELINLKTPLSLNINGREYNFRVILGHISGDNLSSHDIGGFQLNFSSGKICRFCDIDYKFELKTVNNLLLTDNIIRTPEIYNSQRDETLNDNITTMGLKSDCVFNKLNYFKVTEQFPSDIMHDLLEGVMPKTLYLILKYMHIHKLINIDSLNKNLELINLPKTSNKSKKFKATFFSPKNCIQGTASQKYELFLIFPQLVDICNINML